MQKGRDETRYGVSSQFYWNKTMKRSIVVAVMVFVFAVGIEAADKKTPTPRFTFDDYKVEIPQFSMVEVVFSRIAWKPSGTFSRMVAQRTQHARLRGCSPIPIFLHIYCAPIRRLPGLSRPPAPGITPIPEPHV
jgi:hypothetical protein